jgi:DNA-directed RNA polymerase subunit L
LSVRVRVVEKDANKLVLEIEGEDHTLGNLLEKTLLADERVDFASYENPHPLENKIILTVVTRGGANPIDVIREALKSIIDEAKDFQSRFAAEIRRHGRELET